MLSDDEIKALGRDAFGIDPILDGNLMRYARAVERAAYERAAQACEAQISGSDHHYLATHGHWDHMAQAATNCAAAIRALGRQHD